MTDPRVARYLDAYVASLKGLGAIRTAAVAAAFERVPRHVFIERYFPPPFRTAVVADQANPSEQVLAIAYSLDSVLTHVQDDLPISSASSPQLVATMLESAQLDRGMRVLEIGTGTGYDAALIAHLVGPSGRVVSVDLSAEVTEAARRGLTRGGGIPVEVVIGDGADGYAGGAPYDRIIVTVGCRTIARSWLRQLREDGLLLVPLEHAGHHPVMALRRRGLELEGAISTVATFVEAGGRLGERGSLARARLPMISMDVHGAAPSSVCRDYASARGFWFYLGMVESGSVRVTFMRAADGRDYPAFGVVTTAGGALIVGSQIQATGTSDALEVLQRRIAEWEHLGSPSVYDYAVTFTERAARPVEHAVRHAEPPGPPWYRSYAHSTLRVDLPR